MSLSPPSVLECFCQKETDEVMSWEDHDKYISLNYIPADSGGYQALVLTQDQVKGTCERKAWLGITSCLVLVVVGSTIVNLHLVLEHVLRREIILHQSDCCNYPDTTTQTVSPTGSGNQYDSFQSPVSPNFLPEHK